MALRTRSPLRTPRRLRVEALEGRDVPESVAESIETKYLRTRHKRTVPVTIFDTWWKGEGPEEPRAGL